jgi:uncharacterized membrane protein
MEPLTMTTTTATHTAPDAPALRIGRTILLTIAATACFMIANFALRNPDGVRWVNSPITIGIHLATVIPAFFLGGWIFLRPKGTTTHKMLGRVWMLLMTVTAISSFWLRGMTGSLSFIHIFTFMPLISFPMAIYYARIGNIVAHKGTLTGTYVGLLIAGAFSFIPGRLMGHLVFGW